MCLHLFTCKDFFHLKGERKVCQSFGQSFIGPYFGCTQEKRNQDLIKQVKCVPAHVHMHEHPPTHTESYTCSLGFFSTMTLYFLLVP